MNIFKKNQIVVFVTGLMIIAAGYLSYTNNENNNSLQASAIADSEEMASIGDAKLVSANIVNEEFNNIVNSTENNNTIDSNEFLDKKEEKSIDEEETQTTSNNINDYFTSSKLERQTVYSQRIENYQDILNNSNVSETQKKTAQEEITKLNDEQNAIMIAENLIKTKGIEDLIIFVNGESINIIVKGEKLEKEEIAQIQNIVTRELEADIGNIHIMTKK